MAQYAGTVKWFNTRGSANGFIDPANDDRS